jgi:hypothetical protein
MRSLLLALVGLALLAPAASAAEVYLDFNFCACDPSSGGEDTTGLVVTGAPGEDNRLSITARPGGVLVEDAGAPLTGDCRRAGSRGRFCTFIDYAQVDLGDGNDTLELDGIDTNVSAGPGDDRVLVSSGGFTLDGGLGADLLEAGRGARATVTYADRAEGVTVRVNGLPDDGAPGEEDDVRGAITGIEGGKGDDLLESGSAVLSMEGLDGNDVLNGGPSADTLSGGPGDDELSGGDGDDSMTGQEGADLLVGGSGRDGVSYGYSELPVRLSIGGGADDGAASEGDEIREDVEDLVGGGRADVLVGDDGPNRLEGAYGRDVMLGGGGPDRLYAIDERGGDQVDPGAGEDRVAAEGRDRVFVADAEADVVSCFGTTPVIEHDKGVDRFGSCAPEVWIDAASRPDRRGRVRVRLRCPSRAVVECEGHAVLRVRGRSVSRPVRFRRLYPGSSRRLSLRTTVSQIPHRTCLQAVVVTLRRELPSRSIARRAIRCRG